MIKPFFISQQKITAKIFLVLVLQEQDPDLGLIWICKEKDLDLHSCQLHINALCMHIAHYCILMAL